MKSFVAVVFRLCLALLMLINATAQAGDVKPLKLVSSSWPPYVDKDAPGKGAAMDLVSEVFKRAGYATEIHIESWPRSLEGSKIGIYDVVATAWYTEDRNRDLHFSEPYYENVIRFVKRKQDPIRFRSYEDLRNLIVGVVNGYAYGEEFERAQGFLKLARNHVIQNLLLLQQGRIDLAIGDEWVIRNELTQYFPNAIKEFEFLGRPVARRTLHVAVSRTRPDHDAIITAFNKALAQMKADGSMEKLLDKYRKQLVRLSHTPL